MSNSIYKSKGLRKLAVAGAVAGALALGTGCTIVNNPSSGLYDGYIPAPGYYVPPTVNYNTPWNYGWYGCCRPTVFGNPGIINSRPPVIHSQGTFSHPRR